MTDILSLAEDTAGILPERESNYCISQMQDYQQHYNAFIRKVQKIMIILF